MCHYQVVLCRAGNNDKHKKDFGDITFQGTVVYFSASGEILHGTAGWRDSDKLRALIIFVQDPNSIPEPTGRFTTIIIPDPGDASVSSDVSLYEVCL